MFSCVNRAVGFTWCCCCCCTSIHIGSVVFERSKNSCRVSRVASIYFECLHWASTSIFLGAIKDVTSHGCNNYIKILVNRFTYSTHETPLSCATFVVCDFFTVHTRGYQDPYPGISPPLDPLSAPSFEKKYWYFCFIFFRTAKLRLFDCMSMFTSPI